MPSEWGDLSRVSDPPCRNPMLQQVENGGTLQTYRFQIAWTQENGMSTNLKLLAAVDLGVPADPSGCKELQQHPVLYKTATNIVQAIIEPWFSIMGFILCYFFCLHLFTLFHHLLHSTSPAVLSHTENTFSSLSLTNTHTALCSQLNLCIKKENDFCKIVMFMLYEIFIWNCFAKLLYFCMNVFFIGIIRNSYLSSACFLWFIGWFSSVGLLLLWVLLLHSWREMAALHLALQYSG